MSLEKIAVDGLIIAHSSGSAVSGGEFTITSLPSIKGKADGKGVYSGVLAFTFTGGTHSSGTSGSATGGGSITLTATKSKVDGNLVFREGDTGTLIGVYVPPSVPPPTVAFSSDVEISAAGQDLVKGV